MRWIVGNKNKDYIELWSNNRYCGINFGIWRFWLDIKAGFHHSEFRYELRCDFWEEQYD